MNLLLDCDGVVVRDRLLMAHVKHNATRYVQHKLPECKDPADVNRVMSLVYGHTARGLENGFQIDASDYNAHVYDKSLMNHLADVLEGSIFQKDAEIINEIINDGWDVTLFSNAPVEWLWPTALSISDLVKCKSVKYKPETHAYDGFDDKNNIYVDDSLKNLGAIRKRSNWKPIHFNEENKDKNLWCPQVSSMTELRGLINNFE
jgi:hypothetical protein